MGTNFYAILPFKDKEKVEFDTLLNKLQNAFKSATKYNIHKISDRVEIISYKLKNLTRDKKIHLGKRTNGFPFLWNTNDLKYYEPSLKSIKKWILKNKAIIIDQYDNEYTWDEFINEIGNNLYISKHNKMQENDDLNPLENCSNFIKVYNKIFFKYAKDGEYAACKYNDFISKDNLRFSFYTDFK